MKRLSVLLFLLIITIPAQSKALFIKQNDPAIEITKSFVASENARITALKVKEAQDTAMRIEKARMDAVWAIHPAGNDYEYNQCTYYVASRRPVPFGLGNANTWYYRAKAWGFPVGDTPKPGAVGVDTGGYWGHVVYVESVNADGSIIISEQNYDYNGSIRTRSASPSEFLYIY
jgi:surface antigen